MGDESFVAKEFGALVVWAEQCPQRYPGPGPQNLSVLPYMAKGFCSCDAVRDLELGDGPRSSGWGPKRNQKGLCKREAGRIDYRGRIHVKTEQEAASFEEGGRSHKARTQRWELEEAGIGLSPRASVGMWLC